MAQNTAAPGTKGGGKAAPPTATGRAASAAGPAPEVPGSTALAVSPTDPSFLRALRTLIDRPELTSNFYDDREWAYKSSIPKQLGKYLSMVLRYRATLMQIYVDEEGYVTWTFAASLACCSTQTLLSTWI